MHRQVLTQPAVQRGMSTSANSAREWCSIFKEGWQQSWLPTPFFSKWKPKNLNRVGKNFLNLSLWE